jgi:hypothetical protein
LNDVKFLGKLFFNISDGDPKSLKIKHKLLISFVKSDCEIKKDKIFNSHDKK